MVPVQDLNEGFKSVNEEWMERSIMHYPQDIVAETHSQSHFGEADCRYVTDDIPMVASDAVLLEAQELEVATGVSDRLFNAAAPDGYLRRVA